MKQRITVEQLNELSDEQKEKLREWWEPAFGDVYLAHENTTHVSGGSYYSGEQTQIIDITDQLGRHHYKIQCLPLLNAGQMIELLFEKNAFKSEYGWDPMTVAGNVAIGWIDTEERKELADALWEAVKAVL